MKLHKNTYWIGGSPCSGKSTIAEKLVQEFGCDYYKCDDHLKRYMKLSATMGKPTIGKMSALSIDETWLRYVDEQVENEFKFYEEAFEIVMNDIDKLPSAEFQVEKYKERPGVSHYLRECSDSQTAF